jgi:hydrogenase-4 component F
VIELAAALLVLVPLLGGGLAWVLPADSSRRIAALAMAVSVVAGLGLSGVCFVQGPLHALDGLVVLDALGAYVLALTVVVAALAMAASPRYLRHELENGALRAVDEARYYALVLWFLASLVAIPLLDNLGLLWVAIEATTVVSALLVGITRTPQAIEAAWKYLILGTIGLGFALLGTLLAYASSVPALGETSEALAWTRLVAAAPLLDPNMLRLAFLFALVGYGTKMGLVPFHTWLPDAHSQAPSPISALLSGVTLNAALYALVRFHLVAIGGLGEEYSSTLLIGFGLLTIAVALPFMVAQQDLKRLLAYSSVEHMGILALAIGFGGPLALLGATLHMGLHSLVKSSLFLSAGELVQQYRTGRLSRLRGALGAAPIAGGAFGAGLVLLAGLPPSGIFVTEFTIVLGGIQRGYVLAAAAAALLIGMAFAALAFHGARLIFGQPQSTTPQGGRGSWLAIRLAGPLAVVALLGLWTPDPIAAALDAVRAVLEATRG